MDGPGKSRGCCLSFVRHLVSSVPDRKAVVMGAEDETTSPTARVLGIDCFVGDVLAAAHLVVARARSARGGYACFGNAHVLVSAQHDAQLADALRDAWVVFPDGAPVAWLQRRKGWAKAHRVGGPDLMPLVLQEGGTSSIRHFLLGSTPEVVERLRENLEKQHAGVRLVGWYSPDRSQLEEGDPSVVQLLRQHEPDVVWCALGAPRQEIWMHRHAAALSPAVFLGVGAAFDFLAGAKPRAPRWMRRWGLEWLHRLATEPRRLSGRYLRTNSEFVVRALAELLRSA
jgi:N-acetylglucosaminyldiphosphoundecaprenol N-acetyl-beta-D-mannosaminyltransferase